jgi:hypothetical protein
MRLFAVLVAGCDRLVEPGRDGEVAIFRGEKRLNALMFWLRNPDYLAWELLELHQATGDHGLVKRVRAMLADEEPILRRDAMPKWRFGAYERIDNEMAILSSVGLVRTMWRPAGAKSAENSFLLFPMAFEIAATLADNPAYHWYAERIALVLLIANNQQGSALKDRQYKQIEYATTRGHEFIPSITHRVEERLTGIQGEG